MGLGFVSWLNLQNLEPHNYVCGYCGGHSAGYRGYANTTTRGTQDPVRQAEAFIYICGNCGNPTFFDENNVQHPGPLVGRNIQHLPDDVRGVYHEMRESIKCSAFTEAVLLGRKLIMHVAVDVAKAKEGESFVKYVNHLKNSNYIPPNADLLLEFMREQGNEKNHELLVATQDEAHKIQKFVEILLIFIYEMSAEFAPKSTAGP